MKKLKEFNFQCVLRLHLWTKWETVDVPAGQPIKQKRTCAECGRIEIRTVS